MFAAVVATDAALAQRDFSPSGADVQRAIVEHIEEIQSQTGILSPSLLAPLTVLSLFYQEHEDYGLAIAAIERARQVISVNWGLHTLDEAPLLQQLVEIEAARGNVDPAWELEHQLLTLVRRHPDDVRTAPILNEIADRRMDILSRYQAGESPREIVLGCYYSEVNSDGCHAGSRRHAIAAIHSEAEGYRAEAASVVARDFDAEAARVLGLLPSCETQQITAIPDELSPFRRQVRTVKMDVASYLKEMADFEECLQATYERAASTGASPSELSRLVADKDAAVEAIEGLRARYAQRIGPVADLR
jgi:hypothetical protein